MSDGPTQCARMEEKAKREAVEEGYLWDNLSQKEQSRWIFWNERPKKKKKIFHPRTSQCAKCKHYNSISQLCCCTKAAHYGYKITVSASSQLWGCDHYSYIGSYPSSKPSRRKLLLLDT